jgi:acyl-homoserine lactone acylase PvdQ
MKWLYFVGLIGFAALINRADANSLEAYGPPHEGSVRVIRDRFGVPHIIANDHRSLFFGVGYCQAEDQMENLYLNMLRGQGRSAEREGMSALAMDHLVRVLDLPGRAVRQYQMLGEEDRIPLDAFAAGVNAYLKANRSKIPDWVHLITPEEVMAFGECIEIVLQPVTAMLI